ncbi:lamin-B1 [Galendromus occidentalis]|uniref:Lamin-B1 n=1 Tax=Galendromus occidentalis TaxID=34638 RepID=A0AAJ7SHT3_9ACAR|nr:lamin-B1 [Galendromus occidentalis]
MAPNVQTPLTSTPSRSSEIHPGPSNPENSDDSLMEGGNEVPQGGDSRFQPENEKHQLSRLNSRLASYIHRVNELQHENQHLHETLRRVEKKTTIETTSVKNSFHKQVETLRGVISDEAKLRATAEAEVKALQKSIERLTSWNATLKQDLDRATCRLNTLETDNADLRSKHQNATIQSLQRQKDFEASQKQLAEAENRMKTLFIENVTLKEKNSSLTEENRNLMQRHEEQIEEIRKVTESEIVEVSSRVQARAQSNLQTQIEDFRKIYESRAEEQRKLFEEEKERLLSQLVSKQIHDQVRQQAGSLKAQVRELQKELDDKKRLLNQERSWSTEHLRLKDEVIQEANERFRDLKESYDKLSNEKRDLQNELDVYRVLLEREEGRLNLSGSASSGHASSGHFSLSNSPSTPATSTTRKRKRLSSGFESAGSCEHRDIETKSGCWGPIRIADHDTGSGKFIVLENTTDDDVALGRWRIVQRSGEQKACHRFPLQFSMKAKQRITLWSANSKKQHCPPKDYVLRKIVFPWSGPGDVDLSTTIFNPQGKRMAKRVSRLRSFSSRYSQKSQDFDDEDVESVMEDEPDAPTATLDDTSCSVM